MAVRGPVTRLCRPSLTLRGDGDDPEVVGVCDQPFRDGPVVVGAFAGGRPVGAELPTGCSGQCGRLRRATVTPLAGEGCMHLTGERPGERTGPVLPLRVGAAVGAVLHELRRLRDLECPPGGDLLQMRIERVGGVRRVDQLGWGAPALARTLLKDADRVTVAIVD